MKIKTHQERFNACDGRTRIDCMQKEPVCRTDGRCQYAIDHGAEGMGHCPTGKCCMPTFTTEPAYPNGPCNCGAKP
jgi:hypothetical protein